MLVDFLGHLRNRAKKSTNGVGRILLSKNYRNELEHAPHSLRLIRRIDSKKKKKKKTSSSMAWDLQGSSHGRRFKVGSMVLGP